MLGHKTTLNTFKKIDIASSIFSVCFILLEGMNRYIQSFHLSFSFLGDGISHSQLRSLSLFLKAGRKCLIKKN